MSRRPTNPVRRFADFAATPFAGLHKKSRTSPLLPISLVLMGAFLLIGYSYISSGESENVQEAPNKVEGGPICTSEIRRSIPVLKRAYGNSMHSILHVGPETCSVVSKLLKEENIEAWGIEPYDLEDAEGSCRSLMKKGIVRVADIKFALPYKPQSFSLVVISDALDYLSPKYLNKTLPNLARVAKDGLVIFSGYPGQRRPKSAELPKFGRPAKLRSFSWWTRFFLQNGLTENEAVTKKFNQAAQKMLYKPSCQVFHLNFNH